MFGSATRGSFVRRIGQFGALSRRRRVEKADAQERLNSPDLRGFMRKSGGMMG